MKHVIRKISKITAYDKKTGKVIAEGKPITRIIRITIIKER